MPDQQVVTRFAPSPTGLLHIGGARTALFSWAYARCRGGKFLLRLEDTDQRRSSDAAARSILADLQWLGLTWDEGPDPSINWGDSEVKQSPKDHQVGPHGPYFQSQRLAIYNTYIQKLLDSGAAYDDDGAVRFRMDKPIAFRDEVYGDIKVEQADLEDFVIRKADGFPTFHMAVVVDDAEMKVTHVIRGQEHLSNTAKHAALCDALGVPRPVWVHTPSIMNPDGSKMSKRDKAKVARAAALTAIESEGRDAFVSRCMTTQADVALLQTDNVEDYRDISAEELAAFLDKQNDEVSVANLIAHVLTVPLPEINVADFKTAGYLPDVLCNYLALLGWNPGNDVERFDKDFFCKTFDFSRINKANSKFDRQKLLSFNGEVLQKIEPAAFAQQVWAMGEAGSHGFTAADDAKFKLFCAAYQPRSQTLRDAFVQGAFFFADDDETVWNFDDKPIRKAMLNNEGEGLRLLATLKDEIAGIADGAGFGTAVHDSIKAISETQGINMGKYAQPLRIAVSGGTVSPPIDQTLDLLGKAKTLRRIERCLEEASKVQG
jgi:glutamyl-tRNA synthetase